MPAKAAQQKKGAKGQQKKKIQHKFVIDCSTVVTDGILDAANFENFLKERIKVNGKVGNLGDQVTITTEKSGKSAKILVVAADPFSKRYLKYLSKKYLKKNTMRDFLHVVATNKSSYEFKYFDIHDQDEEDGDN
eukprot:CAMPEP_0114542792 /NCGR_PEP_ID=MMETSP0114-20121206/2017_1 /TAXON_ID=31324 /ORGANISM="Goniomonas sp, Strain m" /LENGTH=133 /DNA_ID=CAMNT_0001727099 /DNA_START=70 /DNA_END=471 /DNA_ORIENTATION=+